MKASLLLVFVLLVPILRFLTIAQTPREISFPCGTVCLGTTSHDPFAVWSKISFSAAFKKSFRSGCVMAWMTLHQIWIHLAVAK